MVALSLRVLLAEKEYTEAGLILRSLCAEAGWSLEIMFVDSRAELEQALSAYCPDVVLVQLTVLQPDAPTHLGVLHLANSSVPFILLADPADRACAVACLSMGAKDFMLEGFMDERTMARALCAAWGGQPLGLVAGCHSSEEMNLSTLPGSQHVLCSASVPKPDYAFSVSLACPELLQSQVASQMAGPVLQEITRVLQSCVRHKDLLVSVSFGKWILYFTGIGETVGPAILQRVKSRMWTYRPSFLPSMQLLFTIATEKCGIDTNPAFPHSSSVEAALLGLPAMPAGLS
jgi:DNA-binding NarL/FixJ family response regulator